MAMAKESTEKPVIQDMPSAEQMILSHLTLASGSSFQMGNLIAIREQHLHSADPTVIADAVMMRLLPSLQDVRGELSRYSRVFQRPPKNPQRLNRPELLIQLAEVLKTQHGTVISQGITGIGGVGKTQLAQALVQTIIDSQTVEGIPIHYNYILWFNTESSLGSQFQVFAREYCRLDSCTVDEAIKAVYVFLREKPTLIVFDNAETPRSLAPYLPPPDYQSPLHLLITSRNPHWGETVHTLKLDGFTLAETEAFVKKMLGEQDPVEIRALHDALGNVSHGEMFVLPLALSHALAYIKAGHCTLVEYPTLFGQGIDPSRGLDPIFSDEESINDPHPKTVGTTISLSLAEARRKAPLAESLLCLTAYLAPDNIPVEFLAENLPEETGASIQQTIEALETYSLIVYDKSTKCISVHRLVQATMRRVYKRECHMQLIPLIDHLKRRLQYNRRDMKRLAVSRVYLPHALICAELAIESNVIDISHLIILLRVSGEIALYSLGDAAQGKATYKKALQLQKQLSSEENPDLAFILESLGNAHGELGEMLQQRELLQQALEMFVRCCGSCHLTVASSSMNLGAACYATGDVVQARGHLERALSIFEEDKKTNAGWIAVTLMNLSNAIDDLGEQERMLSRALEIQQEIYEYGHHRMAVTMMNLANVQGKLGNVRGQVDLLEQVLKIQKGHYGEGHPVVARTRVNLANAYGTLGKMERKVELIYEKRVLLEEALRVQESCYGEHYFEIGISLFNLSIVCLELDQLREATLHAKRACMIFTRHYGEGSAKAKIAEELLRYCMEADPSIVGSRIHAFADIDMRRAYDEYVWMRSRSMRLEVGNDIDSTRHYCIRRALAMDSLAFDSEAVGMHDYERCCRFSGRDFQDMPIFASGPSPSFFATDVHRFFTEFPRERRSGENLRDPLSARVAVVLRRPESPDTFFASNAPVARSVDPSTNERKSKCRVLVDKLLSNCSIS